MFLGVLDSSLQGVLARAIRANHRGRAKHGQGSSYTEDVRSLFFLSAGESQEHIVVCMFPKRGV